mgnify:CR=1 FL=1
MLTAEGIYKLLQREKYPEYQRAQLQRVFLVDDHGLWAPPEKENKEKSLHYLVALSDGGYEDFSITKFPFVIGKGKDWADGVVPHSLISRIHAQLEELDGEIFLTDLNSTNGTGVNDEPLEANQTVQLQTGDIINFAQVYYRFV